MPRVLEDVKLRDEVRQFVSDTGSISKAAQLLGFDRTTLWRFHNTGCALEQTRLKIQAALKRNESATNASSHSGTESIPGKDLAPVLGDELKVMRAFCQKMLAMIDMFEHQTSVAAHGATAPAKRGDSTMGRG